MFIPATDHQRQFYVFQFFQRSKRHFFYIKKKNFDTKNCELICLDNVPYLILICLLFHRNFNWFLHRGTRSRRTLLPLL